MGNNQEDNKANFEKLNSQIFLNKFNFFPGETIKGSIELSIKEEEKEDSDESKIISNPKFYYALMHKECWQNNKNNENSEYDNYHEEIIFSKKETLNNIYNKDTNNFITINFQIKIPQNTKPSFEFVRPSKPSDIYGYSRNYIILDLREYLIKKEILIFIQKLPLPLNSELTVTKYITKKKLGFIGSGSNINFQGSYPKNNYGFNEVCPLTISLDIFGSKENIKGIEFTLKRKISFMKNKSKVGEEYVDDLWNSSMKENNLSKIINFKLPLIEPDKIIKERKFPFLDINTINKENLICLLPSYDGDLIKCRYYILIKIFYESMLIKNPEFEMPINLGHTKNVFNQTCLFDINKILGKMNDTMIMALMEDFSSNVINMNNNKKDVDVKSKMKDIFGDSSQKKREQNINKIFGNIPKNINKQTNNKKEETPTPQNNIKINNNNSLEKSNSNLSSSGSMNLPSKEEVYQTKDEQAAPGLGKNS